MRNRIRKYRLLLLAELICLLLVLPGCFVGEERVYVGNAEDMMATSDEEGVYYRSENVMLTPGVYQVRVHARVPEDSLMFVSVESEYSAFQTLRCSGMTIFPGQEAADFEAYVTGRVDTGYVSFQLEGTGMEFPLSVELYRVNWGARMAVFIVMAVSIVLNLLLMFRDKILAGEVAKPTQIAFWMLAGSVALSYFPYLTDYYSFGADLAFHMLRIEGLKETLLSGGQFPVRVQSYWLYDHGYAVSTFYGELFLLIPVAFRLIGFSLMTSYKMFVLLVMTATAGVAWYSFKKCTGNAYAALAGSVLYVLAPYRIYNFYNRGAVGEYLAMVFWPLLMAGIYLLYTRAVDSKEYTSYKWMLVIGLTGVLQSHLLSCEMAVFGILAVCILFIRKTLRKQTFIQLFSAAVICLLINCWFWLPLLFMMNSDRYILHQLVEQKMQYMGTYLAGVFQLWPNMGTAQTGMYLCEPIQIGMASLFLLGSYGYLRLRRRLVYGKGIAGPTQVPGKNPYDKITLFLAVCTVVTLFMSMRYFPWDFLIEIPVIRFFVTALQFPTRMLSPASAFCAAFGAFYVLWLKEEKVSVAREICLVGAVLAVFSACYHVNDIAYESKVVRLYTAENMGTISVVNGEYILEETNPEEVTYHGPLAEEGLVWSEFVKDGLNMSITLHNTTQDVKYLELPVFGYRGYQLTFMGAEGDEPVIAKERGAHGDLRIAVPSGYEGVVKIGYGGFFNYRIAEAVSAVAIVGILAGAGYQRRKRWLREKKSLQQG